jgi:hypothetical protein
MSRLLGRSGRLVAVAAAVITVSLGSLVLIAPSASSSTLAPRSTILRLDHFLCYHVTAKGFQPPTNVLLQNWLQPTPFAPTFGAVTTHCNPADKQVTVNGVVKTYKVVHPLAHLLCWKIAYQFGARPVYLVNQFGKGVMMTTGGPTSLCLPSWKKRAGPPNQTPTAPASLDHFACYPLAVAAKPVFTLPGVVRVADEFSNFKYQSVKINQPNLLCIPTTKIDKGVKYPVYNKNDLSLTCFPITSTIYWKSFWDENQFGQGEVFPTVQSVAGRLLEELCLPTAAHIG